MSLEYSDVTNIRYDPFANSGNGEFNPNIIGHGVSTAERRTVPNSSPYIVYLYEAPQENLPSTTEITLVIGGTTLFEKSRFETPGALEYSIVYYNELGTAAVKFNSAQAGVEVDINYYGLGHLTQTETLDTLVPKVGDTTIIGEIKLIDSQHLMADNQTNATTKEHYLGLLHYTNAEEPLLMIGAESTISESNIYIGGGDSNFNATNNIYFYTASGITTVTGSLAAYFDGSQTFNMYSSDIAHGMTTFAPTNVYMRVQENNENLLMYTFGEDHKACEIKGYQTNEETSTLTSSKAAFYFDSAKKSGASVTGLTDNANMVAFANGGNAVAFIKGDGRGFFLNGINTKKSVNNITVPPKNEELDTAFGQPSDLTDNTDAFIGVIDDNGSETDAFLVVALGSNWFYTGITKT